MLDQIYTRKEYLRRHLGAPLLKEREEFLSHLSQLGTDRIPMQNMASWLLRIIKILKLKRLRNVHMSEIAKAARRLAQHKPSKRTTRGRPVAQLFTYAATKWLRFHGKLKLPARPPSPFRANWKNLMSSCGASILERVPSNQPLQR